jgi:hypothetical protein
MTEHIGPSSIDVKNLSDAFKLFDTTGRGVSHCAGPHRWPRPLLTTLGQAALSSDAAAW